MDEGSPISYSYADEDRQEHERDRNYTSTAAPAKRSRSHSSLSSMSRKSRSVSISPIPQAVVAGGGDGSGIESVQAGLGEAHSNVSRDDLIADELGRIGEESITAKRQKIMSELDAWYNHMEQHTTGVVLQPAQAGGKRLDYDNEQGEGEGDEEEEEEEENVSVFTLPRARSLSEPPPTSTLIKEWLDDPGIASDPPLTRRAITARNRGWNQQRRYGSTHPKYYYTTHRGRRPE